MAQTVTGSVIIIIVCIGAALGFLFVIKRVWVPSERRIHNDAIGPNVSVIETTYAVLMAFMPSEVWSDMQSARLHTEQEANSLVNVFRFVRELPEESRKEIQRLAREYAQAMVTVEWTAMEHEGSSPAGHMIIKDLWHAVASVQPHTAAEQEVMDHSLSELTVMTEHRRVRLLQSRKKLPPILWAVLIVGAIVTGGIDLPVRDRRLQTPHRAGV
jgi:Protein of unknown function (DUF4239)